MAHHRTWTLMRDAIRAYLDEATASFWTQAQLLIFANRAKDRVASEVRKLRHVYFTVTRSSTDGSLTILAETYLASSFAIVAGTRTYTLPPDFMSMQLIETITSGYEDVRFVYRPLNHPDMRSALAYVGNIAPSTFYFTISGERTLRVVPPSDTALDLRITYIQQFADLSADSDELTMPYPLYMAVEHYAVASAMMMDRDPNSAAHEARARAIINEVVAADVRQDQDIEVATGYLDS